MTRKRTFVASSVRKLIYRQCNGRCSYCGCEIPYRHMQLDHVKSLHNGGRDDTSNLTCACRDCNHLKGGSNPEGFKRKLRKFLQIPPLTEFQLRIHDKYDNWNGRFYFEP